MSKTLAAIVGVVVCIGFWGMIFRDMWPELLNHHRLAESGVKVTGAVTAKEPMNHLSVRYDYYVGGIRYSGGSSAVHERFDSIHVGDPIAVTYLPESPAISVCGDAQAAYEATWGAAFIVVPCFTLLAGCLGAFILYYRFRPRAARSSSNQSLESTTGRRDAHI
jgi:hypothetical protein